jgi:hypothetical protein
MRVFRIMLAAPLLGLGLAATPVQAAPAAMTTYHATLAASNEKSPGPAGGTGAATIEADAATGQVCSTLTWSKEVGTPSAAHIHQGPAGTDGPIVVVLTASGGRNCVPAAPPLIQGIASNPSGYYVNIHTNQFPNGAVRGQLSAG